jgi:hypothetical protein
MLYLLQKDILASPLGAQILENKFIRDAYYQHKLDYPSYALQFAGESLHQNALVVLAVTMILLAIAMLGYVLFFAMVERPERQIAWLSSFVLWLILDFALVSTLEVLITNVGFPSIIAADIEVVKRHVQTMETTYFGVPSSESDTSLKKEVPATPPTEIVPTTASRPKRIKKELSLRTFETPQAKGNSVNAAQYLFVSHRVARYFTDIAESQFILSYSTAMPPGDAFPRSWFRPLNLFLKRVESENRRLNRVVQRGGFRVQANYHYIFDEAMISLMGLSLLSNYLSWTFFAQDTVVQLFLTSVMFFLLLLHVELFNTAPYLVVLPLVLVLLVIVIYRSLTHSHGQLHKLVHHVRYRNKVVPHNEEAEEPVDAFEEEDSEPSPKKHSVKVSSASKSARFLRSASSKFGMIQRELKPRSSKYGFESFDDYDEDAVMGFSESDDGTIFNPGYASKRVAQSVINEPLFERENSVGDLSSLGSFKPDNDSGNDLQLQDMDDANSISSATADASVAETVLVYPLNVKSRSMSPGRMDALLNNIAQIRLDSERSSLSSEVTPAPSPKRHTPLRSSPVMVHAQSDKSIDLTHTEATNGTVAAPAGTISPVRGGAKYSRSDKNFVAANAGASADAANRRDRGIEVARRVRKQLVPTVYAFGHQVKPTTDEEVPSKSPTTSVKRTRPPVQATPLKTSLMHGTKASPDVSILSPSDLVANVDSPVPSLATAGVQQGDKGAVQPSDEEKLEGIVRKVTKKAAGRYETPNRTQPSAKFTAPRAVSVKAAAGASKPAAGAGQSNVSPAPSLPKGAAGDSVKATPSPLRASVKPVTSQKYRHVSAKVNTHNMSRSNSVKRGLNEVQEEKQAAGAGAGAGAETEVKDKEDEAGNKG